MNESTQNTVISKKSSIEVANKEIEDSTNQDVLSTAWSTYESITCIFCYIKMFMFRFVRDLIQSAMSYFCSGRELPDCIVELMRVQQRLRAQKESQSVTYRFSRSVFHDSDSSSCSIDDADSRLQKAVEFLHADYDLLIAAEVGDEKSLDVLIRKGTNIQQVDHVGRNALHLAVCSGNVNTIKLLLQVGVNPNVKDNVGMTPLSISLMRRPSFKVAALLFDYGAQVISRTNPMDTGLFLQFVMMCIPTSEEIKIIKLLIAKGARINDPNAPGGRQALHFAAMSNNCDLIKILVNLGADLYAINHRRETPRQVAATFNCRKAEQILQKLEGRDSTLTESSTSVVVELND